MRSGAGLLVLLLAACTHDAPPPRAPVAAAHLEPPPAPVSSPREPDLTADRDHDRIVDVCDVCPDEPETYQGMADEDGCPDRPADDFADPRERFGAASVRVTFAVGAMALSGEPAAELAAFAQQLAQDGDVTRVVCLGRALPTEPRAGRLAERRAHAVCDAAKRDAPAGVVFETETRSDAVQLPWDAPLGAHGDTLVIVAATSDMELWSIDDTSVTWVAPPHVHHERENFPPPASCPSASRP